MTTTTRLNASQHLLAAHQVAMRDFSASGTEERIIDAIVSLRDLCEAEGLDFGDVARKAAIAHKRHQTSQQ